MSQQLRESSANLTRNGEIGNVSTVEGKFRESYYKRRDRKCLDLRHPACDHPCDPAGHMSWKIPLHSNAFVCIFFLPFLFFLFLYDNENSDYEA